MSTGSEQQLDPIEQERRRLGRRLEEVARLCESDIPPSSFYGEMLKRLLECLAAPAGAVWTRTAQGNLQMQFQINMKEVGLDKSEEIRRSHEELLRAVVLQPRQLHLLPHSGMGPAEAGKAGPGNPTDFLLLLVPVMVNDQVGGLLEVWQGAARPLNAIPGFLQFMGLMAELITRFVRNQMLGQMTGQQQLWTQLEAFARQVHGSLNPIEVGYLVANEGRRLVECDRVSVAVRYGGTVRIESISGTDVVEKRSNLVVLMRNLCNEVLNWGEKLVFTGTKDESLPPRVLAALDSYLAESSSKLLVVQPLRDEREKNLKKPARAAMVMECFDPPTEPQQILGRLEVLAKHATPALYNAVEHRRIPMRFLWKPMAAVQEGLGGKARAILLAVAVGLTILGSALYLVPYPLKMSSPGLLLPQVRRVVFTPVPGTVRQFDVQPGETVAENRTLVHMFDVQLENKIITLQGEIERAQREYNEFSQKSKDASLKPEDRLKLRTDAEQRRDLAGSKSRELDALRERTNADRASEGVFYLKAPAFTNEETQHLGRREWTVLNANFKEELTNREVKPSEPLLRLGAKDGPWEIELKIPQKNIGQVLAAFERLKKKDKQELDVDILLRSDPTRKFKGKLARNKISSEAVPNQQESGEAEPVVTAFVRLDEGVDPAYRIPPSLLLSGTEVQAKVRCGNHRLGYAMFYGVWEFLYEKVVFWF